MRYVGGKTRIAKWVASEIASVKGERTTYLEPFLGSGASFVANSPLFVHLHASDVHEDLMLMWQALVSGWSPPEEITADIYQTLKYSEPSALRGYIGFGASWGGKWFGGYVDEAYDIHNGYWTPPYIQTAKRSLLKVVPLLRRSSLNCCSYSEWEIENPLDTAVYCDPPYAKTLGYKDLFDSNKFWKWCTEKSLEGSLVVVSEMEAPQDWTALATRERKAMLRVSYGEENNVRTESLFIHETQSP